jgi:hypothetical protein
MCVVKRKRKIPLLLFGLGMRVADAFLLGVCNRRVVCWLHLG